MSDLLIKGMKMPKHCTECDFWHDGMLEHCLLNMEVQNEDVPAYAGQYPNGCPLVEVPPHGRLIDIDAWMTECEKLCSKAVDGNISMAVIKRFFEVIVPAPTVIPASEEEI